MIRGAMQELRVGDPALLATDLGPVITAEAAGRITEHIEAMRAAGHRVTQGGAGPGTGSFVPPTLIELDEVAQLTREVFGPVLHVVRYARRDLDGLIDSINALGYGLTFGLHTRLKDTIAHVTGRIHAGNIYVNRDIIGAVVGVQPFGGSRLSGTGPKAGGPLYVGRLSKSRPPLPTTPVTLPGPVGESEQYRLEPRGRILLLPRTSQGLAQMVDAATATGNRLLVDTSIVESSVVRQIAPAAELTGNWTTVTEVDAVIADGDAERLAAVAQVVAEWPGKVVPVEALDDLNPAMLVREVSVSINTAAAGGNASLVALKEE
jgi:RHH-type proline utilization regulon transcriptional repressor/proline dehydrogenase/delta 1-pyrroline-5-carboxylate dehydrogenase